MTVLEFAGEYFATRLDKFLVAFKGYLLFHTIEALFDEEHRAKQDVFDATGSGSSCATRKVLEAVYAGPTNDFVIGSLRVHTRRPNDAGELMSCPVV